MGKPRTISGYDSEVTANCERVLVTLLRGLGPWRDSIYLVGGLVPHHLVRARPPEVPPHAGTADVDVVVDLAILADVEAYRTLEANLKNMGFDRAENDNGQKQSWRWRAKLESGAILMLEFLADDPKADAGTAQELATGGNVTAINIPHASIVADMHESLEIATELLGDNGIATETIRYANLVSFTVLKAFAFDHRNERKDAHDLVYCLEHAAEGIEAAIDQFRATLAGPHQAVVRAALDCLERRFCSDGEIEGYRRDGPVAVARFEIGDEPEDGERRLLRQRRASDLVSALVLGCKT
jgi:hypothetical protein